jgi:hypothetical protein
LLTTAKLVLVDLVEGGGACSPFQVNIEGKKKARKNKKYKNIKTKEFKV